MLRILVSVKVRLLNQGEGPKGARKAGRASDDGMASGGSSGSSISWSSGCREAACQPIEQVAGPSESLLLTRERDMLEDVNRRRRGWLSRAPGSRRVVERPLSAGPGARLLPQPANTRKVRQDNSFPSATTTGPHIDRTP